MITNEQNHLDNQNVSTMCYYQVRTTSRSHCLTFTSRHAREYSDLNITNLPCHMTIMKAIKTLDTCFPLRNNSKISYPKRALLFITIFMMTISNAF